jgi:asparagine synthase (glutamine-hydrolysing)
MAASLAHRGPDDEGLHVRGPIGLASRRLSIIDLERGHQPLSNEDESLWVVFNGEIYNHVALRQELEKKGHRFATRSDTEVLVHLYEEEGEECVHRLAGMFAFAVWDKRERKIFAARDRLGQKPIFYFRQGQTLILASEIKAILAARGPSPALDLTSLHHYLSLRFIPAPATMFEGIQKLPPAHLLVFQDAELRVRRYWGLSFRDKHRLTDEELLEAWQEKLDGAVRSHLVSDVPVGAFLSGGMDSSMVVASMAEEHRGPFQAFSIGVEEQSFDELPHARRVASHFGIRHVEERVSSDLIRLLPTMIRHLDEPSDPIAACMYHAAALASRHVKVALGGDGGDELFGGFDRYLGVGLLESWTTLRRLLQRGLLRPVLGMMPESFAYKSLSQKLRWLDRVGRGETLARRYAAATLLFRYDHAEKSKLFTPTLWRQLEEVDSASVLIDVFDQAPAEDPLDRMLYTDYVTRLPEHSLALTDRMSMAHSLEIRSPLLDHELVEFSARLPGDLKIRRRTLKYGLRRLAKDRLPRRILERGKQGFMFPVAYWFRDELANFLSTFLLQARSVEHGIFKRTVIEHLLAEHGAGRVDHHVKLWMLVSFEIWYRMYMEGVSEEEMAETISTQSRSKQC